MQYKTKFLFYFIRKFNFVLCKIQNFSRLKYFVLSSPSSSHKKILKTNLNERETCFGNLFLFILKAQRLETGQLFCWLSFNSPKISENRKVLKRVQKKVYLCFEGTFCILSKIIFDAILP